MKKLLVVLCVLSLFVAAGCKKTIFKANFQNYPQGSPAGPPPGDPTDDQIVVYETNNPVVIGSTLVFRPPERKGYFFSHPVANTEATKTVFWIGRLRKGDGPFIVSISADKTPHPTFAGNPLWMKIYDNKIEILATGPATPLLHSHALTKNGWHEIFITLDPQKETYSISVRQEELPEFKFTGQLHPWTVKQLKENPRILMEATFSLSATASDEYEIKQVIMREKK
jgi:hypothetical protein